MPLEDLLDDLDSEYLDDYLDVDYTQFDEEKGFIEYSEDELDGASVGGGAESIHITTESIHQSPIVLFKLPNGEFARKELADFLFVLNSNFGSDITQRAMLSQAKFSRTSPSWDIDLYQYHLITELPEFIIVSPQTFQYFDLGSTTETSFSNFVFASQFDDPFYVTGERIEPGVTDFDYSNDSSSFNRSNLPKRIWPIEYSGSILKRFIRGTFGTPFDYNPEIPRLVNHLENISNNWYTPKFSTDGGESQFDEPPGFLLVDITVELEDEQAGMY